VLRPRDPAAIAIERGFCRLAHGDVHYRTAGRGPVVLALHESPRSSLSLLPVIEALAGEHQVIAIDTPGYGLSDALPDDHPDINAFLDVIESVLDAFGIGRAAIYGAHTGASLAVAFAARRPARVTALGLDGLSAFNEAEVEAFRTQYLPPYMPRWDGGHVTALWSRVKDLYTWFPWWDRTPARRLRSDPANLLPLQRSALGFLQSGANYTKAYTLAAGYQPGAALRALTMPVTVMARPDDLIASHLDRLPAGGWKIVRLEAGDAPWRQALRDAFAKGDEADGANTPARALAGSRFVRVGEGFLHVVAAGPPAAPVRIVLPPLPGDIFAAVRRQAKAHPAARIVAINPPGCGWSDPLASISAVLEESLDVLDAALRALAVAPAALAGEGAASVLARAWAKRRGWPFAVELVDPPAWANGGPAPDAPLLTPIAPRWDGAHLTGAWFQLRDLALYDTPPGLGLPVRRNGADSIDLAALDVAYRSYMQGPECAALLARLVETAHFE
jgi:pimeloyl-ACP methyl ester carboxylesterase